MASHDTIYNKVLVINKLCHQHKIRASHVHKSSAVLIQLCHTSHTDTDNFMGGGEGGAASAKRMRLRY